MDALAPSHLFSPLQIRDVTLRNRIAVSPMCMYSCEDGFANEWHMVHLGSRAVGGAGAVITEAISVLPEGRISPGDLGIWKDEQVDNLARVFRFVEEHGAVAGTQLAHAGRKASTGGLRSHGGPVDESEGGWRPIYSASAVPFGEDDPTPVALDAAGIAKVVQAFADGARRTLDAGGRLVEIHAAHGYLINQFMSPLSNQRTDAYGGSFDNRTRILREVVEAVRMVWPERYPLFVRISATDWVEGGWTIHDSVALAMTLKPLGVDLIDCSSGGSAPHVRIPAGPGYQIPFAEQIRREAGILAGAVGIITEPAQADQVVRNGQADLVLLGRASLRDPYWPLHAAKRLGQEVPVPDQYARAF
jgi:2,4-dienoyl-CoA reductase-like NADH-dependent reductase (Old Yellow Enzyme family)